MTFTSWLRSRQSKHTSRTQAAAPRRPKSRATVTPRLEALEQRLAPIVGASSVPAPIAPGTGYDGVVGLTVPPTPQKPDPKPFCTGSLLSTGRHILTAAHCLTDGAGVPDPDEFDVQFRMPFGARPVNIRVDPSDNPFFIHPNWAFYRGDLRIGYDIAIITLPHLAPAGAEHYEIYRESNEAGRTFNVAGYGLLGTGDRGTFPEHLQDGQKRLGRNSFDAVLANHRLLIWDFDDGLRCHDFWGVIYGLNHTGLPGGEDMIAPGDSGGPAFIGGRIAGITSWMESVRGPLEPSHWCIDPWETYGPGIDHALNSSFGESGYHTRVSYFAGWIDEFVGRSHDLVLDMKAQQRQLSGNTIEARRNGDNLELWLNGSRVHSDALSRISSLTIRGFDDPDSITVAAALDLPVTVDGGGGTDTLTSTGSGIADDVVVDSTRSITYRGSRHTVAYSSIENLTVDTAAGNDLLSFFPTHSEVTRLTIRTGQGDDTIPFSQAFPAIPIIADGGAGTNTVVVAPSSQLTLVPASAFINTAIEVQTGSSLVLSVPAGDQLWIDDVIWGAGGLTKTGAGTAYLEGASTYAGATTISGGTLQTTRAAALPSGTAVTVSSEATLNLANYAQTIGALAGSGTVTLGSAVLTAGGNNTSTTFGGVISGTGGLTKAGSGTLTLSGNNTYTGTTTINAGTLALSGSTGNIGGAFTVGAGAVLLFGNGGHTVTGTVTLASGATLEFAGTHTLGAGSTVTGAGGVRFTSGTVTVAGAFTVTGATEVNGGTANFNIAVTLPNLIIGSGTLTGTGTVTVTGQLTWTGGTMSGTGATTVAAGATLRIIGSPSDKLLTRRTLNNAGTVEVSGTGTGRLLFGDGATVNNHSGAIFEVQNGAGFVWNATGTRPAFHNAGTFRVTAGGGFDGVAFHNSGQVQVSAGWLVLDGGSTGSSSGTFGVGAGAGLRFGAGGHTVTGTITLASGATLEFAGGTHNLGAGSTVTGAGGVRFTGGSVTVAGAFTVTGNTEVNGGTANFNTAVTLPSLSVAGGIANFAASASITTLTLSAGTANFAANTSITTLTLSGGTLTGAGTVTVTSQLTWTGGTMSGTGTTTVPTGGGLTVQEEGQKYLDRRTLNHGGTGIWGNGGGDIHLLNGARWNNLASATLEVVGPVDLWNDTPAAPGTFDNAGLFIVRSVIVAAPRFTNTGTVRVASGASLYLEGAFTNYANNTLTGGTYEVLGTLRFNGADIRTNAATIMLDGGSALIVNQTDQDALRNFAVNTAAGRFTFTNGQSFTPSGNFTNAGVVTFGGTGSLSLSGGITWSNTGQFSWTGTGFLRVQSALFDNQGTFVAGSDAVLDGNFAGTFRNAGTFRKQGGAGVTAVRDVTFDSSGTVEVLTGTLQLQSLGTLSGTLTLQAGTTLEFGGSYTLTAAGRLQGAGGVIFRGWVTLDGAYAVTGPVQLTSGSAVFNTDTTLPGLDFSGGTLGGSATVTLTGPLAWAGGAMDGSGRTLANGGMTLSGPDGKDISGGRTLVNPDGATATWTGTGFLRVQSALFDNQGTFVAGGDAVLAGNFAGTFRNAGVFRKQGGAGVTAVRDVTFDSSGTVEVLTGTLDISGSFANYANNTLTGGTFQIVGTLKFTNADIRTLAAVLFLDGPNAAVLDESGQNGLRNLAVNDLSGALVLLNERHLTVPGAFRNDGIMVCAVANFTVGGAVANTGLLFMVFGTLTAPGGYTQTGDFASTFLAYATLAAPLVDVQGGVLTGVGPATVQGNLRNAGRVQVGGEGAAGALSVTGNFTQTAAGHLDLEIGGLTPEAEHDVLTVGGTATLDGTLNVSRLGGYVPNPEDVFALLTFNGISGDFATITGLLIDATLEFVPSHDALGYYLTARLR